jgi:hypothetical protein
MEEDSFILFFLLSSFVGCHLRRFFKLLCRLLSHLILFLAASRFAMAFTLASSSSLENLSTGGSSDKCGPPSPGISNNRHIFFLWMCPSHNTIKVPCTSLQVLSCPSPKLPTAKYSGCRILIKLVAQEDRQIRLDDGILFEKLKHNVSLIMH